MSEKKVKLSPKHGLNPSLVACYFCGEKTGEIVLMGKIDREDSEAPRRVVTSYTPCAKCMEKFEKCVVAVEVTDTPKDPKQPPIAEGNYPTGRITTYHSSVYPDGTKFLMNSADYERTFGDDFKKGNYTEVEV